MPVVRGGTNVTFSGGPDGSLTTQLRFRLVQVAVASSGSSIVFSGPEIYSAFPWIPQNDAYFPGYLTYLMSLFQQWKCGGAVLDYEPRVNTSNPATFLIASSDDPCWLKATGQTDGKGAPVPTEANLATLKNACTVVGYSRCRIPLTMNKEVGPGGWAYTMGESNTSVINWDTIPSATFRQTCPAIIAIAGTPNGATANQILGDIYVTMSVSLKDFTTIQTSVLPGAVPKPNPCCRLCRFNMVEEKKFEKRPRSIRSLHPEWEEVELTPVKGVEGPYYSSK